MSEPTCVEQRRGRRPVSPPTSLSSGTVASEGWTVPVAGFPEAYRTVDSTAATLRVDSDDGGVYRRLKEETGEDGKGGVPDNYSDLVSGQFSRVETGDARMPMRRGVCILF